MEGGMVHLIAGALGGTVGAVVTCPLEVIKTRLQSSNISSLANRSLLLDCHYAYNHKEKIVISLSSSFKNIVSSEGMAGLFKGLGPNIIGVAPSRAIYFGAYAYAKSSINQLELVHSDTPVVHFFSAAFAGFCSSTATNPIWVVKTRLQLNSKYPMSMSVCCRKIYEQDGWRGFYRGLTASYYGIAETIIHLVIYEQIKSVINSNRSNYQLQNGSDNSPYGRTLLFIRQFCDYMLAGATSKTIATCVAYPHEVARTRMREKDSHFKGFWQTLNFVFREEGVRGLYRGLATQLVRQIPNTALTMATYEAVLFLANDYYKS